MLFIGAIYMTMAITRINSQLDHVSHPVEYRYIPRTFEEEQNDPIYVSDIFGTMFSQPSPWILSVREYDQRKQEQINAYFVSQM